jgi:hypothetical protein
MIVLHYRAISDLREQARRAATPSTPPTAERQASDQPTGSAGLVSQTTHPVAAEAAGKMLPRRARSPDPDVARRRAGASSRLLELVAQIV